MKTRKPVWLIVLISVVTVSVAGLVVSLGFGSVHVAVLTGIFAIVGLIVVGVVYLVERAGQSA